MLAIFYYLDWCWYAYWPLFIGLVLGYLIIHHHAGLHGFALPMFIVFCTWVVVCYILNGYGVG